MSGYCDGAELEEGEVVFHIRGRPTWHLLHGRYASRLGAQTASIPCPRFDRRGLRWLKIHEVAFIVE